MKGVRYGNPAKAEPGALEMGPLIEERAVEAVAEKVERAVRQGATFGLRQQTCRRQRLLLRTYPADQPPTTTWTS